MQVQKFIYNMIALKRNDSFNILGDVVNNPEKVEGLILLGLTVILM